MTGEFRHVCNVFRRRIMKARGASYYYCYCGGVCDGVCVPLLLLLRLRHRHRRIVLRPPRLRRLLPQPRPFAVYHARVDSTLAPWQEFWVLELQTRSYHDGLHLSFLVRRRCRRRCRRRFRCHCCHCCRSPPPPPPVSRIYGSLKST